MKSLTEILQIAYNTSTRTYGYINPVTKTEYDGFQNVRQIEKHYQISCTCKNDEINEQFQQWLKVETKMSKFAVENLYKAEAAIYSVTVRELNIIRRMIGRKVRFFNGFGVEVTGYIHGWSNDVTGDRMMYWLITESVAPRNDFNFRKWYMVTSTDIFEI